MDVNQVLVIVTENVLPMIAVALGAWIVGQLILGSILKGLRVPPSLIHILSPATTFTLLVVGAYYLYNGRLPF